jgi:hypothetical protein
VSFGENSAVATEKNGAADFLSCDFPVIFGSTGATHKKTEGHGVWWRLMEPSAGDVFAL